jgi:hypothetical protein
VALSGDGVLDVPIQGFKTMAIPISETASELLATHALNGSQRQADAAANVAEQTRLGYLAGLEKIGMREAQAMQDVRTSGLAREIVQSRSAANQPPVA